LLKKDVGRGKPIKFLSSSIAGKEESTGDGRASQVQSRMIRDEGGCVTPKKFLHLKLDDMQGLSSTKRGV
jgi:hypothetical protein